MNSRERLLDIAADIGTGPDDGALVDINAEDAAALRELDQLLADCTHYFLGHGLEDQESRLYDRLAQAGYGEK